MPKKYSSEMRERALRMLAEARPDHPTQMAAIRHVAGMLGMNSETLRGWLRQAEVDGGLAPGVTTDAAAEIKRLGLLQDRVTGRVTQHNAGQADLYREGSTSGRVAVVLHAAELSSPRRAPPTGWLGR